MFNGPTTNAFGKMPYKIQVKHDCGDWMEIDSAATFSAACKIASRTLRRVKFLTADDVRIMLDGVEVTE